MKASLRWLREICPPLPDDPGAVAARLTAAGIEVESTAAFGLGVDGCFVAAVVSTRPHPSRSGLRLVTVDRGGGVRQEVVCGAPNVPDPGGRVVLAPVGAHLPVKAMTIERRSIAGVTSEGMLCSEAELGLGDDGDGLLVLPAKAAAGARLSDALPASRDTIFEISLTPNRPDALGHVGLAREAAALFDVPFARSAPGDPERAPDDDFANHAAVTIEDGERCLDYGAAVLDGARVGPSPLEVRWRLASLGVRPISNVVDVTHLVMLELGHPMHAFDLDGIRGRAIVVRRARAGESLRTLDGIERALSSDDLVICDREGPIALAGVMGGGDCEVKPSTRRVLLECAYFDPRSIRRTARRHGLHTEASHRFERGVDWGDTREALARAATLVAKLSGATAVAPARIVEARALARRSIALNVAHAGALLGVDVEAAAARSILERLGLTCRASHSDMVVWDVPSFRPDLSREVDLIEEIGRVQGYDGIPTELPAVRASRDAGPRQGAARRAREAAVATGLSEAITYAFVSPRDLEMVGAPPATVTLRNPLSDERSVMRTSLLPGLLHAAARARRRGERSARLFTVGSIFASAGASGPRERLGFAALLAGDRPSRMAKPHAVDVWDAKGLARALLLRLLRREPVVRLARDVDRPPALHPRGAAWLDVDGRRVGSMGPVHPDVSERFETGAGVIVELDLDSIEAVGPRPLQFAPLPRFPASTRDLAVVVADGVAAGEVERAVREAAGDLAEEVELFDRFTGGGVPTGRASLALHVVYRAHDRTLTDVEVDARHAHVVSAVEKRFDARLRG